MRSFDGVAAAVLLTAVALLCVSCSKITVNSSPREVAFEPVGNVMTKADYPVNGVFGVFAYKAPCDGATVWDAAQAWPVASLYFDNAAFKALDGVSWSGYDVVNDRSQPYFWPGDGSLMFAGYSPMAVPGGTVTGASLNPNREDLSVGINPYMQIGFTQKTDKAQMVDLMWFDVKDVNVGKTMTEGPVSVTFKHALSKITINFSGDIYSLTSVQLRDCINTATFYSGKTAGWMPDLDVEKLVDYDLLDETATLNGWTSGDLLIIPQYLDGIFPVIGTGSVDMGIDVVLAFTVTDGYGSQEIEIPLKDYTERWVMGKHYVYNIAVNADPIDFGSPNISITTQTVTM